MKPPVVRLKTTSGPPAVTTGAGTAADPAPDGGFEVTAELPAT